MRWEEIATDSGSARIEPSENVVARTSQAWTIIYTIGAAGIAEGGAIRITIPYGFSTPQSAYATGIGYTTAECSRSDARLSLHTHDPATDGPGGGWGRNVGVWGYHVFIRIDEGNLIEGDTITLNYGDGPGDGSFARYFEGKAEFTVSVDRDGTRSSERGGFALIEGEQPAIFVVASGPSQLFVTVPSVVTPGEPFDAKVTVRDSEGNTCPDYSGDVSVITPDSGAISKQFEAGDCGVGSIGDITIHTKGTCQLSAVDESGHILGVSNAISVVEPACDRVYWGDIHVMTEISAGLARPAEAYRYAREDAHLDFCAITDGDHADSYFSDEEWEETRQAVKDFYEPGAFVTLLASEYHERKIAGDKNVYYPTDDVPLIRWSDVDGAQPEALWKALDGQKALTIPHHTSTGSVGAKVWEHHDPDYQRLVEVYSVWGSSECEGCHRPGFWRNNYENSVQAGLHKGYRLGILASGDSHDGLPGNSRWLRLREGYQSGLVAICAPELTREAVFDALWNRRCYGTSGARILLSFTLNGQSMGSELTSPDDRAARVIQVEASGTSPIEEITIIRNGSEVHRHAGSEITEDFEWTDRDSYREVSLTDYEGKAFIYYYVRVVQADGEVAWSSPIWIS